MAAMAARPLGHITLVQMLSSLKSSRHHPLSQVVSFSASALEQRQGKMPKFDGLDAWVALYKPRQQLPLHQLTIDRSFMVDWPKDKVGAAIFKALIWASWR